MLILSSGLTDAGTGRDPDSCSRTVFGNLSSPEIELVGEAESESAADSRREERIFGGGLSTGVEGVLDASPDNADFDDECWLPGSVELTGVAGVHWLPGSVELTGVAGVHWLPGSVELAGVAVVIWLPGWVELTGFTGVAGWLPGWVELTGSEEWKGEDGSVGIAGVACVNAIFGWICAIGCASIGLTDPRLGAASSSIAASM